MRFFTALFFLLCAVFSLKAQDIHYSQFYASPLNLNPASTGDFDGDVRVMAHQRSQWLAIPVPYNTYSLGADVKDLIKPLKASGGVLFNYDRSGDSRFTTMNALFSLGRQYTFRNDSTLVLFGGLQTGISQKSISYSKLYFDNQYDGLAYDASLPTGENFTQSRITYPELALGFGAGKILSPKTRLNAGFSMHHLIPARQSFQSNASVKLDRKFLVNSGADITLRPGLHVLPMVYLSFQGKMREMLGGSNIEFDLAPVAGMRTILFAGLWGRGRDALISVVGMQYKEHRVGVSYDVNASTLRPATNLRGGIEFSYRYIFRKPKPFVPAKKYCPVYM